LKGARYSLCKNPENLTENQHVKLAWIAATDPKLYRAYLLKEGLRVVFQLPHDEAIEALDRWISWARRCRIPPFVKLQKSIVKHRARILAAIEHNLSNGLIESTIIWSQDRSVSDVADGVVALRLRHVIWSPVFDAAMRLFLIIAGFSSVCHRSSVQSRTCLRGNAAGQRPHPGPGSR